MRNPVVNEVVSVTHESVLGIHVRQIDLGVDPARVVAHLGQSRVQQPGGVALAAHAALRSGVLNVMINVKAVSDRQFVASQVAELDELLSRASAATEACEQSVRQAMS